MTLTHASFSDTVLAMASFEGHWSGRFLATFSSTACRAQLSQRGPTAPYAHIASPLFEGKSFGDRLGADDLNGLRKESLPNRFLLATRTVSAGDPPGTCSRRRGGRDIIQTTGFQYSFMCCPRFSLTTGLDGGGGGGLRRVGAETFSVWQKTHYARPRKPLQYFKSTSYSTFHNLQQLIAASSTTYGVEQNMLPTFSWGAEKMDHSDSPIYKATARVFAGLLYEFVMVASTASIQCASRSSRVRDKYHFFV